MGNLVYVAGVLGWAGMCRAYVGRVSFNEKSKDQSFNSVVALWVVSPNQLVNLLRIVAWFYGRELKLISITQKIHHNSYHVTVRFLGYLLSVLAVVSNHLLVEANR